MSRLRRIRNEEDGFSLAELLVAIAVGMIVLLGVFAVVQAATRSSNRTTARVIANQSVRPVLSKIIDELHSSCISPDLAPVLAGTDTSVTFVTSTDSGVTPVPSKRTITWTPVTATTGTLTESTYAYSSGTAPSWTFSATPTTTTLLKNVGKAKIEGATAPIFQYYAYDPNTGLVATSPLGAAAPAGLSAADLPNVVKVVVSFSYVPAKTTVTVDTAAAGSFSDSALLRFSPASTATGENTPCS
jgi:Tfp pilus assembly protein PilW